MVALDLFPAILSCGLSGYAQIVLAEVLMQSYGPRKRERVFLHASELAELTGLNRGNARRAIKELLDAGIVTPDASGFRFVKDYESWNPNQGPLKSRLGGRLLEWIHDATSRLGIDKRSNKSSESTQTQNLPVCGSTQTQRESTQTQDKLSDESTQTQPEPTARVYPDSSHYNDRANARASEDTRDNNRELISGALSRGDEVNSPKPAPEAPAYPHPDTSIFIVHTGPHPEDEPSARRIWAAMWGQWKSEKLCSGFYQHQRWYKSDSWLEAIRAAVSRAVTPGDIRYLETIAADVEVNGAKRHVRTNAVANGKAADKSPTYHQPMPKPDWMVAAQEAGLLGGAKK
jgi:Bacteriophage replication protein O